jgi:hypothetical protein
MLCSGQRQTRPQAHRIRSPATKQSMSQSYSKIRKTEEDGCTQRRSGHKWCPVLRWDLPFGGSSRFRLERADNAMLCHTLEGETLESGNAFVKFAPTHLLHNFGV